MRMAVIQWVVKAGGHIRFVTLYDVSDVLH
jgi:hypothetical protein